MKIKHRDALGRFISKEAYDNFRRHYRDSPWHSWSPSMRKHLVWHNGHPVDKTAMVKVDGKWMRGTKERLGTSRNYISVPHNYGKIWCPDCGRTQKLLGPNEPSRREQCVTCEQEGGDSWRRVDGYHDPSNLHIRSVPDDRKHLPLLGVELELGFIPNMNQLRTDHSCVEFDASLPGSGGEMVTSAMTLSEHKKFFAKLNLRGCSARKGCGGVDEVRYRGMHIHMNKAFMSMDDWSMMTWWVFDQGLRHGSDWIPSVFGRVCGRFCTHPERYYFQSPEMMRSYLDRCGSHEDVFNSQRPRNTIEFRLPQSSRFKKVIVGRIEMVDAFIHYQKEVGFNTDTNKSSLFSWMEKKRCYTRALWLIQNKTKQD